MTGDTSADIRPFHLITNWSARGGTEGMLARYLSESAIPHRRVVALMDAKPELWPVGGLVEAGALHLGGVTSALRTLLQLQQAIRVERPTVLVCWLYHAQFFGSLAARLAGYTGPIVWNIRGSIRDAAGRPVCSRATRALMRVTRVIGLKPDLAISNSKRALVQHVDAGYVAAGVVISNVVDVSGPPPEPRSTPRVIGIAGRFHSDKDYPNFFKAAAIVAAGRPQIRFVAAGSGLDPANPALKPLIERSGLPPDRLTLLGEQPDLSSFYRSIDLFVLSSRTEGFPNVLALRCALDRKHHQRPFALRSEWKLRTPHTRN